jgi:hypothetical protein
VGAPNAVTTPTASAAPDFEPVLDIGPPDTLATDTPAADTLTLAAMLAGLAAAGPLDLDRGRAPLASRTLARTRFPQELVNGSTLRNRPTLAAQA